ncbi:uncharacterized protein [Dermacentor andersoni]|uniref:uncharacterized protein n=1 Tax=Dermacentor andersoni TaxID=34620 RepID=UPI00215533FF|nr:collagen alpha-2(I) chain-like [Dermacentor andersoni]
MKEFFEPDLNSESVRFQLLLLLFTAGAATAALTQVGHSPDGRQQYRTQGPGGYSFGYSHAHGAGDGASWRKESADAAGNVIGSYGLKDADGRVRVVTYVANQDGFQANVQLNEPGLPQQHPGLGAGITQWPIPQGRVHGHNPGAHPGTAATTSHRGSWAASGSPHVASGHADAPGGASYSFSYDVSAAGGPFQQEIGDALGNKKGIYGLPGRTVNYVADAGGFRSSVQSNEPGVDNSKSPADAVFTGSPSAVVPPPSPSASSGNTEDGNGLVFPPPYLGGTDAPATVAPGSVATGYGTQDASGAQDPANVDVIKRPEPAGIALVYSGPPGSPPSGAALVPPFRLGAGAPTIPVAPVGGAFPAPPGATGPVDTGYGQQDGSGAYNFAYGNGQIEGPWQQESGDAEGNKAGSYGLRIDDGRFRTVNYVAGTQGFRASVDTNEPGVDGAQSPADVIVNKSPGPEGIVPGGGSSGPNGGTQSTAAGGLPGVQGRVVIPAAPVGPAITGLPGVSLVSRPVGFPSVQEQTVVPVGSVGAAVSGLPAASWVPGTTGFSGIRVSPSGPGAPGLNVPVPTGDVVFTSPSLGPAGGYSFDYSGGPGGAFHREAGDASGSKTGIYGFNGEGGAVRTVNYVADNAGFRASVQSNEPGVDTSQYPAHVSLSSPGGAAVIPAASSVPSTPHTTHHAIPGGHAHAGTPHALSGAGGSSAGPWSPGNVWPELSQSHGPGGFSYKTEVLGPHQSVTEVHQY